MARARNIKPGFFTNDKLVELPIETRLLFVGLWTLADKAGRLEDRPKKIKMEVFPADNFDVETMLEALANSGFVVRYTVGGTACIEIVNWAKHQSPHHTERESTLPARCVNGEVTVNPLKQDGGNPPDSGFLIPDSGFTDSSEAKASVSNASPKRSRRQPKAVNRVLPCPYDKIVALYHERLPTLPSVRLMPKGRQADLRKVWGWVLSSTKSDGARRATTAEEALVWLGDYFARASENDWLMGRTPRHGEHANWQCDLDFLLTDRGMKHVIEKTIEAAA